ncbi:MAG TPA: ribose-phosphate diphosphokinase [Steroidobacteraceae bacterium]|nr:ribose-phosphate diphosphokinase [Steroidobacteraceae bacterium]
MSGLAPCFFALSESRELAALVGQNAGLALARLEERRFEGGEFKLRPLESVRGRRVFVLQSLAGSADWPTAERLVRLLFLLAGLKDAGAVERVALLPYLTFARKERRTQLRDPVNTRYVAQLLEATGLDRLIALDVHNPAALDNSFRIPVDHLSALPMMADHFARRFTGSEVTVVSPDVGGIKRAQLFRELLQRRAGREVELAFIEKRRAQDVVSSGLLVGEAAARNVIVIDDLCATGGTLIRAAEICRRAGASAVHVAVTHAPRAEGIAALTATPTIDGILITDSVGSPAGAAAPQAGGRIDRLSIAPLFGQALRRILAGKPLAPLLERWPVAFEEET